MPGTPVPLESRLQHYWQPTDHFAIGRCPGWIWEPSDDQVALGIPAFAARRPAGPAPGHRAVVKAAFHTGERPADQELGPPLATPDDLSTMLAWLGAHAAGPEPAPGISTRSPASTR